jgi:hypothetical protein
MSLPFVPIGETPDAGFFSLEPYGGRLFAGTYGTPRSYEWNGGSFREHPGGLLALAGESLFDMVTFSVDGQLYGTTENTGRIFRFRPELDGWEIVFEAGAPWNNAYSIVEYQRHLFTGFNVFPDSNRTLVCRSGNGVDWATYELHEFNSVRFGVFGEALIAVGEDGRGGPNQGRRITDPLAEDWPVIFGGGGNFSYRPFVWRDRLYYGSEAPGGTPPVRLFSWDGADHALVFVTPDADGQRLGGELMGLGSWLYWITGVEFRAASGTAKLYRSADGLAWEQAHVFDEPEGWCLGLFRQELYAGTRQEGGGGRVYRLPGVRSGVQVI